MIELISEKPYRFVPPYRNRFWNTVLQPILLPYLRRAWGIESHEIHGVEHLRQSLAAGHGVLLAANHCRPADPMAMGLLIPKLGTPLFTMASWHLFMNGGVKAWLIRRIGGFSIYREGVDREALRTAIHILATAERPLLIFPEGIISRTNDCLGTLQEGITFIARSAAKQRAKSSPAGKVVVHPVALRYYFRGNLVASAISVLEEIEKRLSWRPQRELALVPRIHKIGEALLSLKEIEYFGSAQPGTPADRLPALIERLLAPLEKEWLGGQREPSLIERLKKLRIAIVPGLVAGDLPEDERMRRWRHLGDIYLTQQLSCYPADYLTANSSPERILETVERFEEDLRDEARIHRPLHLVFRIGPAQEVSPARGKHGADDPLLKQIADQLQELLGRTGDASQPAKLVET